MCLIRSPAYYQGFTTFNYGAGGGGGGGGGGFSTGYSAAGAEGISASRGEDSDSEPDDQHDSKGVGLVIKADQSPEKEEEEEEEERREARGVSWESHTGESCYCHTNRNSKALSQFKACVLPSVHNLFFKGPSKNAPISVFTVIHWDNMPLPYFLVVSLPFS